MSTTSRPSSQAARLSALEEGYRNLGREIGGLRDDFATFARDVRGELHERSRVQWSPIIAGVAVVVTILGGLITLGAQGPMRDLARHDDAVARLEERVDQIRGSRFSNVDGHRLEDRVRAIEDEDFSRGEYEVEAALLRAEIARVRDRFEKHVEDGHPTRLDALLAALEARVGRIEAEQRRRAEVVYGSAKPGN